MKNAKEQIRLAALGSIKRNGAYIQAGDFFVVETPEEARSLVESGAAVEVEAEGRKALTIKTAALEKYLTQCHDVGRLAVTPTGDICEKYYSPDGSGSAMAAGFLPPDFRWTSTTDAVRNGWVKGMTMELKKQLVAKGFQNGFSITFA